MPTLGARVDNDLFDRTAKAAAAAGMKVSAYIIEAVEEKMQAGKHVNSRQLPLLPKNGDTLPSTRLMQIRDVMLDGKWRSLPDIADAIGAPDSGIPSISARLRELRKPGNGKYTVEKRQARKGCYEYRVCQGGEA